jgi:hypothetical protein
MGFYSTLLLDFTKIYLGLLVIIISRKFCFTKDPGFGLKYLFGGWK